MNLDKFLQNPESTPADYTLHAVLVHSGDNHGGHYVVFINPKGDGKWCKFDDDVVSCCSKNDAVDNNFGGGDLNEEIAVKHSTNAYMLVYIRDSALSNYSLIRSFIQRSFLLIVIFFLTKDDVLQTVTKEDIQDQLIDRLQEEKRQEALRRKERNEAHLFVNINGYTEDSIMTHKGIDLINSDRTPCLNFKVNKNGTYKDAVATIAEQMKFPVDGVRIWPFITRNNHSYRPTRVSGELELMGGSDNVGTHHVFIETIPPELPYKTLPPSDKDGKLYIGV